MGRRYLAGLWILPLLAVVTLRAAGPSSATVVEAAKTGDATPVRLAIAQGNVNIVERSRAQAPVAPVPAATAVATQKALLDRYCITCHNERLKTGGLVLEDKDLANVPAHAGTWEKVVKKLRARMMPPPGRPRPDAASADGLVAYLEGELDRHALTNINPGRTEPFHRLNRAEYQNAVRDLLGVQIDAAAAIPADGASFGFDNMAGVLKMSPTLVDRYLTLANKVSRLAVGTPPPAPSFDYYRLPDDLAQELQVEGLPFGTRGGTAIPYFFPMDAEYQISVRAVTSGNEMPNFKSEQQLEVSIDGAQVKVFVLPVAAAPPAGEEEPDRSNMDAGWNVRVPVKAGQHTVVATFLNRTSTLDDLFLREPFIRPFGSREDHGMRLKSVEISGPYNAAERGETDGRARIFICTPSLATEEAACAKTILSNLTRRAYRRPITDKDVKAVLAFYEERRKTGGDFEAGIESAVKALLVSPHFLFRTELDPPNVKAGAVYKVSDLELASRLSFFLWSSIPDEELFTVAVQGRLNQPRVLEQQVRRMLADERANQFVANFAGQWLFLRNVPATAPDILTFSNYDEALRRSMRRETELFVESILREDRSVLDMLTARYTFVNERLAKHYDIPGIKGNDFRRIELPADNPRGGLLGQGAILTITSYPNRTSPVVRGKWILENLLGTPPPDPPPNVPALKDNAAGEKPKTLRERMAAHRRNPVCSSCHSIMEPLGLALEHFNAVGMYRDVGEGFSEIDATGEMPDGTKFDGFKGLTQAIGANGDRFAFTLTEKLLTYALGRGLEAYDTPVVRQIIKNGARTKYRFASDIVMGVVKSVPFQMRKAAPEDGVAVAAR